MPGPNYTQLNPFRTKDRPLSIFSSASKGSKQRLARIWPYLSFSFGLFWLVPAIFVLALNFMNTEVGPSIGCLQSHEKCRLDLESTTQIQQAKRLQKDDQEASAGLQLAAKALDAWFCFIAASLVWSLLKRLAGQNSTDSLPVGYIHLHTECSDLRVLPKLLWGRRRDASRMVGRSKTRLYVFITFVTFVCILCNLMGPATAVLVIPNLEWMDINDPSPTTWFKSVLSDSQPLSDSIAHSCNVSQLLQGEFSCTFDSYEATTDMVVAAAVATNDQSYNLDGRSRIPFDSLLLPPILQEQNVSFTVNFSDFTSWIPSRQTLRNLTTDLLDYDDTIKSSLGPLGPLPNYPDSTLFTRSLQSRLLQHGPVLGQTNLCYAAYGTGKDWKNFTVSANRRVRCYEQHLLTRNTSFWKCVPMGAGWTQFSSASATFRIQDFYRTEQSNGNLTVSIYSATASLDIGDSTFQSMVVGHDFDWTAAFSNSSLPPDTNHTGPRQIFEYRRDMPFRASNNQNLTDFIYCDSQTKLGLADYVLNPSLLSNPIRLVETNVITDPNPDTPIPQTIYIHPDWTLAAWSVDRGGDYVGGKRGAARRIVLAFEAWIIEFVNKPEESDNIQAAQDFRNIHKFMGAQTVSFIPYTVLEVKPKDTFLQPILQRKAMVQLWKYDFKTPSSVFAVVIMLLGIILVIARTVIYTTDRDEMKDATQILVTALQQAPNRKGHRRNDSSTSSLQPPATPTDMSLMDADIDNYDDDEEGKTGFPVLYFTPVTSPGLSLGASLGTPRRVPYERRISFHG